MGLSCISVDLEAVCHLNDVLLDSLSQFDRKLWTKNADDPKEPLSRHMRVNTGKMHEEVGSHDSSE